MIESFIGFAKFLKHLFVSKYLVFSNEAQVRRTIGVKSKPGFQEYAFSWDFRSCVWKNAPAALVSQRKKQKQTTVIFESIVDGELYICRLKFIIRSSSKDVNILNASSIV